jgi:hypothetical protein
MIDADDILDEASPIRTSEEEVSPDADDPTPDGSQDSPHRPRDARKRYLAKIGKLAKDRDRLTNELRDRDLDTERIVDERIRAYESERVSENERRSFFAERPDAAEIESDLEALRDTFPAMSWQDAYVFHAARHAPDKLVDRRILAQRKSKALDTSAYVPTRLRSEPDASRMSAREYGHYLDALIAGGKITL